MNTEEWEQVVSCLPMMRYIARQYIKPARLEDAMTEVGIDTLMRCTELWDGRNEFSTYAYRALTNEFMSWNLKNARRKVIEKHQSVSLKFSELLAVDHRDHILLLMSDLDAYDRMLLIWHFWADLNMAQISEKLGVPSRTIERHLKLVIKKLQRADLRSEYVSSNT